MGVDIMAEPDRTSRPARSPALKRRRMTPEPSAALLALQQQGLELPKDRENTPAIPLAAVEFVEDPASKSEPKILEQRVHTSSLGIDRSESVYSQYPEALEKRLTRRASSGSVETTVSNIIRLYASLSKQSLRSEYEDVSHQSHEEGQSPPVPKVHEPKAYHDTVAPLLRNQFLDYDIPMVPIPSPLSVASMPAYNVSQLAPPSVPSPPISPEMYPTYLRTTNTSHSSIQITPDTSPLVRPTDKERPGEQVHGHEPVKRPVNLEVPDVREADSWYDQPLSPTSTIKTTEISYQVRMSTISDDSIDLQKTPLYSSFPPLTGEDGIVPPPLDLSRSKTVYENTRNALPAHVAHLTVPDDPQRKPQKARIEYADKQGESSSNGLHDNSAARSPEFAAYLIDDPYMMKEPQRSTSAFSTSSSEPAADSQGDRPGFAAKFKSRFLRKDKKISSGNKSPDMRANPSRDSVTASRPAMTPTRSKFGLRLGSVAATTSGPKSRSVSHLDLTDTSDAMSGLELGPVLTAFDLQRIEHYQPPSMHDQPHEESYDSAISQSQGLSETTNSRSEGHEQGHLGADMHDEHSEQEVSRGFQKPDRAPREANGRTAKHNSAQQNHNHSGRISTSSSARVSNVPNSPRVVYNNALFEASGGVQEKKRNTIGKMFRSAEEKRKDKLKESIMIIGSGRLDSAVRPRGSVGRAV